MADFGLSIDVPKVDKTLEGTAGKVVGRGLTMTLDTAIMKNKLSLGWLLDPFLALLPADLRTQISPWLALTPKFVFHSGYGDQPGHCHTCLRGRRATSDRQRIERRVRARLRWLGQLRRGGASCDRGQ